MSYSCVKLITVKDADITVLWTCKQPKIKSPEIGHLAKNSDLVFSALNHANNMKTLGALS